MISKEEVLKNLDKVKEYVQEIESDKKEEKKTTFIIHNRFTGEIIWESTKTTYREAVEEAATRADLTDANLTGADLTDADLTDADLTRANLTDADLTRAKIDGTQFYMGYGNKNFPALCKAIKTLRYDGKTGSDFIK